MNGLNQAKYMKSKINYLPIVTFYLIAVSIRYLTNKTTLLDSIENYFLKIIIQGIGPTIGAIIAFLIFKIQPVMTLKGNYKNIFIPISLYGAMPIIIITVTAYIMTGNFAHEFILAALLYGLFEEIGWRGFLHQVLQPIPKIMSIFIVASLWFIWHLNFELTIANFIFFGVLVLGSWGIGKVADRTNSLLAVAGFHSLYNFFSDLSIANLSILVALSAVWILSLVLTRFESISIMTHNKQYID